MRHAILALAALLSGGLALLAQPSAGAGGGKPDVFGELVERPACRRGPPGVKKTKTPDGSSERELLFTLEASIPGFEVVDRYRSLATASLCSVEFEKDSRHGKKVTHELTTFDQPASTATRQTLGGGGKSQLKTSACARDALAFLDYLRREVAAGRVPPSQTVYFGGPYQVRLESAGRQRLELGEETMDVDRFTASVKGKASDLTFEIFLARDSSRRPVLVRVPLPPGTFSMELVP